jgi:RNase H-fold protein (predicted Holliday junction resolvase)
LSLEELQTKAVLRLMKKLLIETVVAGEPISKEKLTSEEIKRYISRKTEAIQNQEKKNVTLIEDEADYNAILLKK